MLYKCFLFSLTSTIGECGRAQSSAPTFDSNLVRTPIGTGCMEFADKQDIHIVCEELFLHQLRFIVKEGKASLGRTQAFQEMVVGRKQEDQAGGDSGWRGGGEP